MWKIIRGFDQNKERYSNESLLDRNQLVLPVSTKDTAEQKYIVQWAEASSSCRPAVVFVPGFLTETPKEKQMDSWTSSVVELAEAYDFAAYGLYWPSNNLRKMLLGDTWTKAVGRLGIAAGIGAGIWRLRVAALRLNPVLVATAIGGPAMANIAQTWTKVVELADKTSVNCESWLSMFDRPVILIGHSLGGRIVLKTSQYAKSNNILQTFAFAPAVLETECDFSTICSNTRSQPAVFYSKNDLILNIVYRLGERTRTLPLGYAGIKKKNNQGLVHSFNASKWHGKKIGHFDYTSKFEPLLSHPGLQEGLDAWR